MADLIMMDLYRMRKSKVFWICLLLSFLFAVSAAPFSKLMYSLANMLGAEEEAFESVTELAQLIADPLPLLNGMLALLSVCSFFYADYECGYIKNIAGQTPKKSASVISKFTAAIPHGLCFMLVGVIGGLIGSLLVGRVTAEGDILNAARIFLFKLLLLQAISTILLLVTGAYRSKPLGTAIAVLAGLGLLSLLYFGIDSALDKLFSNKSFMIGDYMPDQLLRSSDPDTLVSIVVSAVTIGIFLPLSVSVFNKKEVK